MGFYNLFYDFQSHDMGLIFLPFFRPFLLFQHLYHPSGDACPVIGEQEAAGFFAGGDRCRNGDMAAVGIVADAVADQVAESPGQELFISVQLEAHKLLAEIQLDFIGFRQALVEIVGGDLPQQ